jgi:DNA mismatch repair protein MutS
LHDWYIQYRVLKAAHPDSVLLYRLGDFYETFDDDAKLIADLLEVTLTHRPFATPKGSKSKQNDQQRCPMAGMPYHAIERYVGALPARTWSTAKLCG